MTEIQKLWKQLHDERDAREKAARDEEIWRTTKKSESGNGGGKHYLLDTETGNVVKGNIGKITNIKRTSGGTNGAAETQPTKSVTASSPETRGWTEERQEYIKSLASKVVTESEYPDKLEDDKTHIKLGKFLENEMNSGARFEDAVDKVRKQISAGEYDQNGLSGGLAKTILDYLGRMRTKEQKEAAKRKGALAKAKKSGHSQTLGGISKEEEEIFSGYCDLDYLEINEMLRAGKHDKTTDMMKDVISRTAFPGGTLYRGIKQGKTAKRLSKLKPGQTFRDDGFVSTAHWQPITKNFMKGSGVLLNINAPSGYGIGIDVEDISENDEGEAILNAGTRFRVKTNKLITTDEGEKYHLIECNVIPADEAEQ